MTKICLLDDIPRNINFIGSDKSPLNYFLLFVNEEIRANIVLNTNLYADKNEINVEELNKIEFIHFLGILYTSLVKLPQLKNYG